MQLNDRQWMATAILAATLIVAWLFRYETLNMAAPMAHQNRFTGAICAINEECWIKTW